MKSAVIVFPGSNCDRDMQVALRHITGVEPSMGWHRETEMPEVELIAIPGGFSFGDYLRSGAIAANSQIMREVALKAEKGVPILGVCNGFQVLTETGLLPGALMRNANLKYVCRDVCLQVAKTDTPFTMAYEQGQVVRIPIAHHDGNYFADNETLDCLENENRIAFRYCDESGTVSNAANPNGSQRHIAGILNAKRNVLGMMPHPERSIDDALGSTDGRTMLDGLVAALA